MLTNICDFKKAHSTQHALFRLLQSCQKELDNSGCVGTILTDLCKDYDCIQHDLLIVKFEAYRLDKIALNFLLDYFSRRIKELKSVLPIVNG